MTVKEFRKYLNKNYEFDKYIDYFSATVISCGGFFFVYKLLLTDWSKQMELYVFLIALLFSFYMIYFGLIGFFRIPNITRISFISTNIGTENNKKKIQEISKKFNLFIYPYEIEKNIIKMETKNLMFARKELFFLCNEKGIYFNIQHKNFRDPKYGYYYTTKKMINRIKNELTDCR